MRILLHTMACPDRDPEGALALAQDLELDGVELICQSGYRCGIPPDATLADARRLAREARAVGTRILALTPYAKGVNAVDPDARRRAVTELEHVISLAAEFGCEVVRIFAGAEVARDDMDAALVRATEPCRRLGDVAQRAGLTLCLENHMDTMALSASLTMRFLTAVDHQAYGILYDQANLDLMEAEAFPEAYELQRDIRHVHVKDFKRDKDGARIAVPVGEGIVPWPAIIQRLHGDGYNGCLSLEYERRWFPDQLPPAETGVARSRDALRAIWSEVAA
ncbi:sugar phosphate isomerase/epimerase family protein [Alsobacter sp. SYSU BS001988]